MLISKTFYYESALIGSKLTRACKVSLLTKYDWRLQSESARLNALRLNERASDGQYKAIRKKTKRKDAEMTEFK